MTCAFASIRHAQHANAKCTRTKVTESRVDVVRCGKHLCQVNGKADGWLSTVVGRLSGVVALLIDRLIDWSIVLARSRINRGYFRVLLYYRLFYIYYYRTRVASYLLYVYTFFTRGKYALDFG